MITLLTSVGLFAFAALAIPLAIHLIRRPERRLHDFAALRWLADRERPRERLRLHDRWLLLARLLLLAVLASVLATPFWQGQPAPAGVPWVIVMPGLDAAQARALQADPAAEWHWLAPGWPSLEQTPPAASAPASLIRELDGQLPAATPLTIVVPDPIAGLDAEHLQLRRRVDWRSIATPVPTESASAAPLEVALRADAAHAQQAALIRGLVAAWQAGGHALSFEVLSGDATPPAGALLFSFDNTDAAALRAWIEQGGRWFGVGDASGESVLEDDAGVPVLTAAEIGAGRVFHWQGAFEPVQQAVLQAPDFPARLWPLLQTQRTPIYASAAAAAPTSVSNSAAEPGKPLAPPLLALAALLFVIERLLASRRGAGQ